MNVQEIAARYRLVIYDLDGTLCENVDARGLLPGREAWIQALHRTGTQQAVATNQGGAGARLAGLHHGWKDIGKFKPPEEIDARIRDIFQPLYYMVVTGVLPVYVALAWQDKHDRWWLDESSPDPRWHPEWRKPAPTMLRMACEHFAVAAAQALMVGDGPDDAGAAQAVGCHYLHPRVFFPEGITA